MKKGFTLIELLVVVLIIGILSAVALPQYTKVVERTRASEALTIFDSWVKAEKLYYLENGAFFWQTPDSPIQIGFTIANFIMTKNFRCYLLVGDRTGDISLSCYRGTPSAMPTNDNPWVSYNTTENTKYYIKYNLSPDGTVTKSCTVLSGGNANACKAVQSVFGIE